MENIETAIAELNKEQHVPQSIEFTVQEDFINNLPKIVSNLEQVEAWAIAQTEEDRTAVLETDEDFEKARERCAQLKKVIDLIDRKRIDTKKEYNRPCDIFEKACKRVTAVLQSARDNKWSQITKAEEEKKLVKQSKLRAFWDSLNKEAIGGYRTFEQIFDSKWLNKTVSVESAFEKMQEIFKQQCTDVSAIWALKSEFEVSLIEHYKSGHSISEVISYNNRLQEAQKQAEINRSWHSDPDPQLVKKEENLPPKNEPKEEIEELIRMEFFVECTNEQLQGLGKYLREHGIKYGRIRKE